jgi:Asp-tRNA(Asn)/Glu-tRNA(Gln) amidotransferase B subunit
MVDGLGLIIEDEDNDASTLDIDEELKKTLADIEAAASVDDLLAANKRAMAKYANNANAITFILGTYAQARKRLTGGPQ